MAKPFLDQQALIDQFATASAQQGEALRQAVGDATLRALQGRELTLRNIRQVLETVTQAVSAASAQAGATGLPAGSADPTQLLTQAFEGMDAALLQAVEAHRRALQQFVDAGSDLRDKPLKGALAHLEKMEDVFFETVAKGAHAGAQPLAGPWDQVLEAMKLKGTATGGQAQTAMAQLMETTRQGLRDSRALGLRTGQALIEGYATLVSGVLIGLAQGMQAPPPGGSTAAPDAPARPKRR